MAIKNPFLLRMMGAISLILCSLLTGLWTAFWTLSSEESISTVRNWLTEGWLIWLALLGVLIGIATLLTERPGVWRVARLYVWAWIALFSAGLVWTNWFLFGDPKLASTLQSGIAVDIFFYAIFLIPLVCATSWLYFFRNIGVTSAIKSKNS